MDQYHIEQLTDIFAISTCAYSVMSNHYHVILHVDTKRAAGWSEQEFIERRELLFTLPVIVQRYLANNAITQAERNTISNLLTKWRIRLHSISWFMRCINPSGQQRRDCTERYWEGVTNPRPTG
jgi:hypothetical protein